MGNSVGKGDMDEARSYAKITVLFSFVIHLALCIFVLLYKDGVASYFTNEDSESVYDIIRGGLTYVAMYIFFGSLSLAFEGLVKGVG